MGPLAQLNGWRRSPLAKLRPLPRRQSSGLCNPEWNGLTEREGAAAWISVGNARITAMRGQERKIGFGRGLRLLAGAGRQVWRHAWLRD